MENCANSKIRSDNKKLYLPDLSKDVQASANASILSNCFDKKNDENVIPIRTPVIKSTTETYNDHEYWTTELIKGEHYRFKNLATTFGKTYFKDEKGEYLYLYGLDVDSDNVLRILSLYLQIHCRILC